MTAKADPREGRVVGNQVQASNISAPLVASTDEIRAQFPALDRQCGGYPVAYFDGPGGTQVPRVVPEAVVDYLYHHNANRHWGFPTSDETDEALDHARNVFGTFLNAEPKEVVFGANMTTLTYHASRALGSRFDAGDEIVVTELDHHANIGPWTRLETERGVRVRWARMIPESGLLDWDHLAALIGERTKLLAIGAASNALGTVTDVRRAADLAHEVGALVFVDGVHYAPHVLPDVVELGCDFFVCSPYKFYGPHLGVLYGKLELLNELDFPRLEPTGQQASDRAETGTLNFEGIVGAAAAIEWLASLADGETLRDKLEATYTALHRRGEALFDAMWRGLSDVEGVTLFGPPPSGPRTSTAAFVVAGVPFSEAGRGLVRQGVFASSGHFYAKTVVDRLGLAPAGLVRAGCACYTTREEVDRLVDGVRAIAE
jgi:cysteine desulfurase family protein (TIGR01976 family)